MQEDKSRLALVGNKARFGSHLHILAYRISYYPRILDGIYFDCLHLKHGLVPSSNQLKSNQIHTCAQYRNASLIFLWVGRISN